MGGITGTIPPKEQINHVELKDMPDPLGANTDHDARYALQVGLLADRPAPGIATRCYWTTDTLVMYRDNGVAWAEITSVIDAVYDVGWNGDVNHPPSRNTVYDMRVRDIDPVLSPMLLTGGDLSPGTNAGTMKIGALTALLRISDSDTAALAYITLAEQDNETLAAANTKYHIILQYNAGSPTIVIQAATANGTTDIGIGNCMKEADNTMHYTIVGMRLANGLQKVQRRAATLREIELARGCTIADTGIKNFSIAAGVVYEGLNRLTPFSGGAFDSSLPAYTFTYIYRDGVGGWTEVAAQSAIDDDGYDDGTGILGTVAVKRYGNHWVYVHPSDEHVYVVYGRGSFKLAEAEVEQPPPSLPLKISDFAVLLGRLTFKRGDNASTVITMVTDYFFTGTAVADHGELAGLADDDHLQYVLRSNYDAQSILRAIADNTPTVLTVAEQRLVGRITAGNITALTAAQVKTLLGKMHPDIGTSDWGELSEFHPDNWEDLDEGGGSSSCANKKMTLSVPFSANADIGRRRTSWFPQLDFDKDQRWIWLIYIISMGGNVNAAFCAGCNGGVITGKDTVGFKIKDSLALFGYWVEEDTTAHEIDLSVTLGSDTGYALEIIYTAGSKLEWFVGRVSKADTEVDLPSGVYDSFLINEMTSPAELHLLSNLFVGKIGYDLAF